MRNTLTERRLRYLANSPSHEHGGFEPQIIETAKAALRLIALLRKQGRRHRRGPELHRRFEGAGGGRGADEGPAD